MYRKVEWVVQGVLDSSIHLDSSIVNIFQVAQLLYINFFSEAFESKL